MVSLRRLKALRQMAVSGFFEPSRRSKGSLRTELYLLLSAYRELVLGFDIDGITKGRTGL